MSKHVFVYITVFILALIGFIFFALIKTDYNKPVYNFSPFPTVQPPNVPAPTTSTDMPCKTSILKCSTDLDCTAQCGQGYECTPVGEDETVMVNGTRVKPGFWCLPSGKSDVGCGTYTSRAIWSDFDGEQKWKCVCLYPDLFGGDTCMEQLACRDGTGEQTNNVLVDKSGNKWDPNDESFVPNGKTPYDTNSDGSPMYTCQCNQNKGQDGQVKYTKLPGDPYRCHLDPCTSNHMFSGWNENKSSCDCPSISKGMYAHSNVTGQCLDTSNVCTWNDNQNQCQCSGDSTVPLNCNSKYMQRDGSYPACTDENNPGGSYCGSPCQNFCENGGKCSIVGQKPTCDCTGIISDTTQYSGDRCQNTCLKDGTIIPNDHPDQDRKLCCSGHANTRSWDDYDVKCCTPGVQSWC